jgi:hypothetical protein
MSRDSEDANALVRLQEWFASCADGEWEHRHVIRIGTLDNPGWTFTMDLAETPLANHSFEELWLERTDDDWIACRIEDGAFRAACGVHNLEEALTVFLDWTKTSAGGK